MKKIFGVIAVLALAGCTSNGLSTNSQTEIATAKAQFCPSLQAVQDALALNNVKLNNAQQTVVDRLNTACNGPAPTTVQALTFYAADVAVVLVQISSKKH